MRSYRIWLALLAAGFVAAAGGYVWLVVRFVPQLTPWMSYLSAFQLTRAAITACALLALGAVIVIGLGLRDLARGRRDRSTEVLLRGVALVAALVGGAGSLFRELLTRTVIAHVGGHVSFGITAPGRAEALLTLAAGLLAALIALGGSAFLYRRWVGAGGEGGAQAH